MNLDTIYYHTPNFGTMWMPCTRTLNDDAGCWTNLCAVGRSSHRVLSYIVGAHADNGEGMDAAIRARFQLHVVTDNQRHAPA